MGQSFVQGSSTDTVATTSNLAKAFASNNAANNLLVFTAFWDPNAPNPTIADSRNAITSCVGPTLAPSNSVRQQTWAAINAGAGANTVTVSWGAPNPTFSGLAIHEYSDSVDHSGGFTLDKVSASTANGTNPQSGNTAVITNATSIVFGAAATDAGSPATSSGFNQRELGSNLSTNTEDKFVTNTAAQSASFVNGTISNWVAQCVTFFTAPPPGVIPSSGAYQQEQNTTDRYQLEDGSGVYLIEPWGGTGVFLPPFLQGDLSGIGTPGRFFKDRLG